MCNQGPESADHLFLGCVIARQLWHRLLAPVGLAALVPEVDEHLPAWWLRQRRRVHEDARRPFDAMVLLVAWSIWKERNNRTFQRVAMQRDSLKGPEGSFRKQAILQEAGDWVQAGFSGFASWCHIWSQNSVHM
jgi:hypothetical protein